MRKRDPSAATEVAAAVTVATAPREDQPAVTDRQVKMVRLFSHVLSFSRDKLIVNTCMLCSSFVVASTCLTVCSLMFSVSVADYISRPESQSRQNLPQKENHAGPEPKVQTQAQGCNEVWILLCYLRASVVIPFQYRKVVSQTCGCCTLYDLFKKKCAVRAHQLLPPPTYYWDICWSLEGFFQCV